MEFNVLIGGAAGQGMDTVASLFNKVFCNEVDFISTLQQIIDLE